ncbi:hypothetical protein BC567DRAFT_69924 [Phyllosticta citribraziliensis]
MVVHNLLAASSLCGFFPRSLSSSWCVQYGLKGWQVGQICPINHSKPLILCRRFWCVTRVESSGVWCRCMAHPWSSRACTWHFLAILSDSRDASQCGRARDGCRGNASQQPKKSRRRFLVVWFQSSWLLSRHLHIP